MSNLTFYTMNEMFSNPRDCSSDSRFRNCLNDYPNLKDAPALILSNYQDWYGNWTEEEDSTKVMQEHYNQLSRMISWLQTKAIYLNEYITRQSALKGTTTTTAKFLDTPETASDYSGDTHITNINKSETTADNVAGLETLRPIVESLVNDFRRTWLLPKEAI